MIFPRIHYIITGVIDVNEEIVKLIGPQKSFPCIDGLSHHWMIPSHGVVVKGRCKNCGGEKYFYNGVDGRGSNLIENYTDSSLIGRNGKV